MSILGNSGGSILGKDERREEPRRSYEDERPRRILTDNLRGDGTVKFEIVKINLVEMVRQQPIYSRPYAVVPDGNSVGKLAERIIRSDSGGYNPGNIADLAGGIIRPSSRAYETAADARWMSERKFMYDIKILAYDTINDVETYTYVTGITNHADVIDDGVELRLREDMVFDMSTLFDTYIMDVNTPARQHRFERIRHVYDVITGQDTFRKYTQRPIDMFGYMKKEKYLKGAFRSGTSPYEYGGSDISIRSPTSELGDHSDRIEPSKVINNVTSFYMSSILKEGVKSEKLRAYDNEMGDYYGDDDVISDVIAEPCILDNDFVAHLNAKSHYSRFRGSFTYGDLLDIDRYGATKNCEIIDVVRGGRDDVLGFTPDEGEVWSGRDKTSVTAFSMLEASIALAAKLGWTQMRIIADGYRPGPLDKSTVKILPPTNSILNVANHDLDLMADHFRDVFMSTIFMNESHGGRIPLFAEIIIDVYGNSKIKVGRGGDRPEWFTMPTGAGKYSTPIASRDRDIVNGNRELMQNMIRDIHVNTETHKSYY